MPQQRASSGRTARCQPTARLWEQTVAHGLGSRPNHQAAACPGQPAPPRAPQWAPGRWPGRSGRSAPGRGRSAGGGGAALGVGAKGRDGRGRHAVGVHAASKCPCFVLQGGGGGGQIGAWPHLEDGLGGGARALGDLQHGAPPGGSTAATGQAVGKAQQAWRAGRLLGVVGSPASGAPGAATRCLGACPAPEQRRPLLRQAWALRPAPSLGKARALLVVGLAAGAQVVLRRGEIKQRRRREAARYRAASTGPGMQCAQGSVAGVVRQRGQSWWQPTANAAVRAAPPPPTPGAQTQPDGWGGGG